MNLKYQFFISSTQKDLISERQIAIDAIMKSGHIPAGMEWFGATGEEQFESIKPIIDESDYYLIILGGKYGTVIKKEKISYTEKEFNYALETGKRIIAFVHSDPDNLPASKRESNHKMINYFSKFRTKVLENRMVCMWKNEIELSQGISTSITKVIDNYPSETYWLHIKRDSRILDIISSYNDAIFGKVEMINIFSEEQCAPYYRGIPCNLFEFKANKNNNSLILTADFTNLQKTYDSYKWAGIYIRSLPCHDWRKYILNGSLLKFSAIGTNNVKSMWLEIKSDRVEMCKRKIEFEDNILKEYCIDLGSYCPTINDWEYVREICFVIYPEYTENEKIVIEISNLRIES